MEKVILVVEEDPSIRENIANIFEEKTYRVITSSNAKDAVNKLCGEIPYLLISGKEILHTGNSMPHISKDYKNELQYKTLSSSYPQNCMHADDKSLKSNDGSRSINKKKIIQLLKTESKNGNTLNEGRVILSECLWRHFSHEFRTPLTPIISYSEIIHSEIETLSNESVTDMIEGIKNAGSNLLNTTEKMLYLSELEWLKSNDIKVLENYSCEINENYLKKFIANENTLKQMRILAKLAIEPAYLRIHETGLKIILKELFKSASKYSRLSPVLRVKGEVCDNSYNYEICNTESEKGEKEPVSIDQLNRYIDWLGLGFLINILDLFGGELLFDWSEDSLPIIRIILPLATKTK